MVSLFLLEGFHFGVIRWRDESASAAVIQTSKSIIDNLWASKDRGRTVPGIACWQDENGLCLTMVDNVSGLSFGEQQKVWFLAFRPRQFGMLQSSLVCLKSSVNCCWQILKLFHFGNPHLAEISITRRSKSFLAWKLYCHLTWSKRHATQVL